MNLQHSLSALAIQPSFFEENMRSQDKDPKLVKLIKLMREKRRDFQFMRMEV